MTLPPLPQPFVGRDREVHDTRTAILQRIPAVIYGLVGVGKGSVCLAAGHSREAQDRHGANAWVVDCEGCDTKDRLLAHTVNSLFPEGKRPNTDAGRGADTAVEIKLQTCTEDEGRPALLIFNNVEALLRAPDCESMLDLVKSWAEIGSTVVLLGVHSATEPRVLRNLVMRSETVRPIRVPRLTDEQATELFLWFAPQYENDPELPAVIEALDGVALAVALAGRGAYHGDKSLAQIRQSLAEGGSDAVTESVKLAVDAFRADNAAERWLLALLGRLPAGISQSDLSALVSSGEAAAEAVSETGLAFLDESESLGEPRWRTLKPVRERLVGLCECADEDLTRVRDHYLGYVRDASCDLSPVADRGVVRESENVDATIELVTEADRRCDLLLAKGESEWRAGRSELSLPTFAHAADLARRDGDAIRLAKAALGFSGGMKGSGHSFDHGDAQRLRLLREALDKLGDREPGLRLRLLRRLLHELHFDTTDDGAKEREARRAEARATAEQVTDKHASLEVLLLQLSEAGPKTVPPTQRLEDAADAIHRAEDLGDARLELSARMLRAFALLEAGRARDGNAEIALCRSLAGTTDDDRGLWKVRVMERAMMLFAGRFDAVRDDLGKGLSAVERDQGIVAERRSMHQEVVLAMDTGDLTTVVADVEDLVRRLREHECEKLNLREVDLRHLPYQWWPTWRANQALVLAGTSQGERASDVLDSLGRNRFKDIMPAEYWLQAVGVIAIAAAWNFDYNPDTKMLQRLYDLLRPYADRSIVPGSVAMNLGSVATVLGMLAARLRRFSEAMKHLRSGLAHNEEMGSPPAVARTQLELALLHQRRVSCGEDAGTSRQAAADAATECLHVARELDMKPLTRQAIDVRRWAHGSA